MSAISSFLGGGRELCPFCFEYFDLKSAPFRCSSPMSRCAPEVDPVLDKEWQDNTPVGKVIETGGTTSKSVRCPACSNVTHKRICPHCHSQLPHTTGEFRNYIFAVIGAKEAGKSHYLAVLIEQIRQRFGPELDLLLEPMGDSTIKRYRNDFYEPVYRQKRVIDATHSALANRSVRAPLVYSLTKSGKNFFGKRVIKSSAVLVFFDTAGEDLNDDDVIATVNKYIYRSDGIILLIDPLQLSEVRTRLAAGTPLPGVNTETSDIINRTTRLIQNGRGLPVTSKIPIPMAVAFSKFDAVKPLVDDQFQLNSAGCHRGGFHEADFDAVNSEMMALLGDWGCQDIVNHVRTMYDEFGFFGLTALGCNPHQTSRIAAVQPHRVEDPFLWLLARNRLMQKV